MAVADHPVLNGVRFLLEWVGLGGRIAPYPIRREARPWRRDEVPAAPSGWVSGGPDYVGVGSPKSGTSWWAALIEAHPGVSANVFGRKETHYLAHFLERGLTQEDVETYRAAFARPAGTMCGEWTPNYLANPHAILRLREAAPKAKVLAMFRDPVARYESGFNHERKQRFGAMVGPGVRMSVIKKYALRTESIWYGMYAAQMEVVLSVFPREQVLVLQYERCRAETTKMLARTYRFLGLDDGFQPAKDEAGRDVNTQRRIVAPLSEEAKGILRETYGADSQRLAKMFPGEIDLSLWSSGRRG